MRPDEFVATSGHSTQETDWLEGIQDFNSGIAAIVPAGEILHVLNQSVMVDHRAREREEAKKSLGGTLPDYREPDGIDSV